jgi:hypothetical protein
MPAQGILSNGLVMRRSAAGSGIGVRYCKYTHKLRTTFARL